MKLMKVHYVGWASQPYVEISCQKRQVYVWDDGKDKLPEGVYSTDDDEGEDERIVYTFDRDKVTCDECINDLVDLWHESGDEEDRKLHEFLGWSWDKYAAWVKGKDNG